MQHHRFDDLTKAEPKSLLEIFSHYRFTEIISSLLFSIEARLCCPIFCSVIIQFLVQFFFESDHSREKSDRLISNDWSSTLLSVDDCDLRLKSSQHVKCYLNQNIEIQCKLLMQFGSFNKIFIEKSVSIFSSSSLLKKRRERTLWTMDK